MIKALLLGLKPEAVGYLQSAFSHENIEILQSKTLKHATYLLSENEFSLHIVDSSVDWIVDIIIAIKQKYVFAPIIVINDGLELHHDIYSLGVMNVFNRPIQWQDVTSLAFNLVIFFRAHHNSKDEFAVYSSLVKVLNYKDQLTKGHSERTAELALTIFDKFGYRNFEDRESLRVGAYLHDIGKVGIPDYILKSNHALSDEDFNTMKQHPLFGVVMVSDLINSPQAIDIIRHHHEKIDGSGYPDGLFGDKINYLTQIVTVTDIFDALTNNRTYRSKNSLQEAVKIMQVSFADENKINKDYFEVLKDVINHQKEDESQ